MISLGFVLSQQTCGIVGILALLLAKALRSISSEIENERETATTLGPKYDTLELRHKVVSWNKRYLALIRFSRVLNEFSP